MVPAAHPEIAIIGSGLSGLSLALHLSAQGIKSTVYEFRPANYSQGGEIALSPNALRVLDHLGISNALSKNGFNSDTMTLLNRSGKALGTLVQGSLFGYAGLRLKRTFVKEALVAECGKRGVEIMYGKRFMKVVEGEGKIKVFFEDGSMVSVDLVVGADGLRSGVRGFVNDKVKATYNGTMMIYGKISASTLD
jgi:2-polyprenyl-6-methoxyphenol hydroxylase-like FAD-dependent oxidoreductase